LPVFVAEAIGRLKVIVSAAAVTVKSVPFVEVANVIMVPDCICPAGPIWLMLPEPEPHAVPVPVTDPLEFICRHCVPPFVMPLMTRLVVEAMVVESVVVVAFAITALVAVSPPLNAMLVVVALPGNAYPIVFVMTPVAGL
jgi:hypothetical protein